MGKLKLREIRPCTAQTHSNTRKFREALPWAGQALQWIGSGSKIRSVRSDLSDNLRFSIDWTEGKFRTTNLISPRSVNLPKNQEPIEISEEESVLQEIELSRVG